MSRSVTAVYSGTFHPITLGHEDVVYRAAQMFDKVVLAVAATQNKKTSCSLDERLALAKDVTQDLGNGEVVSFTGLRCDFVHSQGARVIVRGLRSVTDYD